MVEVLALTPEIRAARAAWLRARFADARADASRLAACAARRHLFTVEREQAGWEELLADIQAEARLRRRAMEAD